MTDPDSRVPARLRRIVAAVKNRHRSEPNFDGVPDHLLRRAAARPGASPAIRKAHAGREAFERAAAGSSPLAPEPSASMTDDEAADYLLAPSETGRLALFQLGDFTLNSGIRSPVKIECDALTDDDIETCAFLLSRRVDPFDVVEGVPRGGLRLAEAMEQYAAEPVPGREGWAPRLLIVDDVLTTGGSLDRWRKGRVAQGAVLFAYTQPDPWIVPLFTMTRSAERTVW